MGVRAGFTKIVRNGMVSYRACNSAGVCYRFSTRAEARKFAFGG